MTSAAARTAFCALSFGLAVSRFAAAQVITESPIPTRGCSPLAITSGADGNVWFTEWGGNNIGRVTPKGVITEFPIRVPWSLPLGIVAGPDGAIWFVEFDANRVVRFDPATGSSEFLTPDPPMFP